MADDEQLRRLGGGRWQTRDRRFTIEPQSGTWVVVDGERRDELGLPLVRGPFGSLRAAREGIEAARAEGETGSPLADRLATASAAPAQTTRARSREAARGRPDDPARASGGQPATRREPAAEPAWLTGLDARRRAAARRLIARLTSEGVSDAEAVVRTDLAGTEPALTRLALRRRIARALGEGRGGEGTDAVLDAVLDGRDGELGVRWQVVDGEGRRLRPRR